MWRVGRDKWHKTDYKPKFFGVGFPLTLADKSPSIVWLYSFWMMKVFFNDGDFG